MPTIEEKIDASKAVEAELLAQLLTLPGAEVINANGENLLHAIDRQRETTWRLGRWLPQTAFGLQGQLNCAQAAQQAQVPVEPAEKAVEPAPEPEPPTLVATEPPAPEAPAAEPS